MTQTLQALYDYTLESRFSAFLTSQDYQTAGDLFNGYLDVLHQILPKEQSDILEKLCDALYEQRDMELEAMFQATWRVAAELQSST